MRHKIRIIETTIPPLRPHRCETDGSPAPCHHHDGGENHVHVTGSSRTYYYIKLEFDNRERKEFPDVKHLFGLVAKGDTGYAMTQGDWIVAFERNKK